MGGFLLVYDLDGTLVDSVPDLHAAVNAMLRERGHCALSPAQVKRMVGDGAPALVRHALEACGESDTELPRALPRFLELYEANASRLSRTYPRVKETLRALRQAGYRQAVCTNKPQRATMRVLEEFELLPLFDGVAGGDRYPVRKPDPGHLLGLLRELSATAEQAAMIGDNENDAAAAKAAGMPILLMRYGYSRVDPETLGADALLDQFGELPAVLTRLGLIP